MTKVIQNDGNWRNIFEWMKALHPPFGFAMMTDPPIMRNSDGTLRVRTKQGEVKADIGDWVMDEGDDFYSVHKIKPDVNLS